MTTPHDAPAPERGLVRAVGVWALAASIVNITVGGGIFRLPAAVGAALGTAAPLAYLVCALAMGLIVLCFAEAGSRVALTGGPYAYVEVAFGPFVGFLAGVLLWIVGTFALAAVATLFADAVGALVPALAGRAARALVLAGTFALLAGVNVRGVRQGTAVNVVSTVAKLLPLLLLLVVGAFAVNARNLAWGGAPSTGALARTSVLLIFAFAGIETALVPSGEVRNVARTIPRAIALAMVAITVLYIGLHLVVQGILGGALATSTTPLADAAAVALGPSGRALILVGAAVSMFGYVSGMTLAVPRALFALGRDGFLPRAIAAVHPRWHTPYVAIAVQAVIAFALGISSGFEKLAILANLSTLLLYAACCLAAWQLRRRDVRADGIPFRVPPAAVVPWLALAVIAFLLKSITLAEWMVVLGVMAVACVLYAVTIPARSRRNGGAQGRAQETTVDRPDEWRRIEAWLSGNAPAVGENLRPPASAALVEQTEAALGVRMPPSLRAAYLRHDGESSRSAGMFGLWRWFPLEEVVQENEERMEIEAEFEPGNYQPGLMIPIMEDGGGNLLYVETSADGEETPVIDFDHVQPTRDVQHPSFAQMLSHFADRLEKGELVVFRTRDVVGLTDEMDEPED